MEELSKLEHLSLVSKICTELDNHLGMNDKDLAEFIIDLAEKHTKLEDFKKVLIENGAEFPDSFITNLLRIIQLMKRPKNASISESELNDKLDADRLAMKFPGLAMPNKKQDEVIESVVEKDEKKVKVEKNVADDMMAELEAFAPSTSKESTDDKKKVEKRERSRERKRRSPSRDRKTHRHSSRDRERERKRSRSLSRLKERRRSKDRRERSRFVFLFGQFETFQIIKIK